MRTLKQLFFWIVVGILIFAACIPSLAQQYTVEYLKTDAPFSLLTNLDNDGSVIGLTATWENEVKAVYWPASKAEPLLISPPARGWEVWPTALCRGMVVGTAVNSFDYDTPQLFQWTATGGTIVPSEKYEKYAKSRFAGQFPTGVDRHGTTILNYEVPALNMTIAASYEPDKEYGLWPIEGLSTPEYPRTRICFINTGGNTLIGERWNTASGQSEAFTLKQGKLQVIPTLAGGLSTRFIAASRNGGCILCYGDSLKGNSYFIYRGGKTVSRINSDNRLILLWGINNKGQAIGSEIVFERTSGEPQFVPILWKGGEWVTASRLTSLHDFDLIAINDSGVLAIVEYTFEGTMKPALLRPK